MVYISRGATASTGSPPREGAARLCSARDAYPRDYAEEGWPRAPTTRRPEGGDEAKKTRPQVITTKIWGAAPDFGGYDFDYAALLDSQ